eukprot:4471818-Amphidinium_carterae.1
MTSHFASELPAGTLVTVAEEVPAPDGRSRLRLTVPVVGWVTAKFIRRAEGKEVAEDNQPKYFWKPAWGGPTLYPAPGVVVSAKTPMGRPPDIFGRSNVDLSFASPAALAGDFAEVRMWLVRAALRFNASLGKEVQAALLNGEAPEARASVAPVTRSTIVYLAGVEGTGHHGVMPMILYAAVKKYGTSVLTWWRSLREVLFKTPPSKRKERLRTLMTAVKAADQRPLFIFEWCSWPFGEESRERWADGCSDPTAMERELASGNPGNSIDLQEFITLFSEYGDVRVLVLHRSLAAAAWSHKDWDDGLRRERERAAQIHSH